ncbi:histidine phosphatase superfamily [Lineolata rhizophorae]|uniref:Histidine phosphatase superfamily n=1 Tax=Lineolata rhizophorae TaxID=578093 RepID=A0A6A6NXL3_9PEZI|nr:histidine phosphatase superfamily [Lineolata rhizophorae]
MSMKLCLALYGLIAPAVGETVLGVTVFSRHGDRTSKHYPGYRLTNLGKQQNFQSGAFYRDYYLSSNSSKRILGISENVYLENEIWASAPDQQVLLNTATAFLQGLYPPLETTDAVVAAQTLNNGSSVTNPLNGYQYVVLHGEDNDAPDTIWIKGDDSCPEHTAASGDFTDSEEFIQRTAATKSFYESFWDVLDGVYDFTMEDMTYGNAYEIFDLINVGSIHNGSMQGEVSDEDLFQLRTLADSYEFGKNFNRTQPMRSIGAQTLSAAVLRQLNETIVSQGQLKFSLFAGSYDTFLSFFGLTNLTNMDLNFYGLPQYASTMAFELFTDDNITEFPSSTADINVRFGFRNGSEEGARLLQYGLFGRSELSMSWDEFSSKLGERAVSTVGEWCSMCQSTEDFCRAYTDDSSVNGGSSSSTSGGSHLSNAVAGVIGAMVTLGVFLIGVAFFFLLRRSKSKKPAQSGKAPSISSVEA